MSTQAQEAPYLENTGREGLGDCLLESLLNSDCKMTLHIGGHPFSLLSLRFW